MSNRLPKPKKLVPISEAAKVLGVSIDTVRRWDKSGVLHSERADGKNRYFSLDELEKHKLGKPLSISEAARELGISAVTLRRLDTRGLIKPDRNSAGERVYSKESLKNFLESAYFLRKKPVEEKIPEPLEKEETAIDGNHEPKSRSRMPEFLTISTVVFLLLVALGMRGIQVHSVSLAKSSESPSTAVLAETQEMSTAPADAVRPEVTPEVKLEAVPEATPEATLETTPEATPEAKPRTVLMVKTDNASTIINIRQKPNINSKKIGQVKDGDTLELISIVSDWYEIKLNTGLTGFISEKFVVLKENTQ